MTVRAPEFTRSEYFKATPMWHLEEGASDEHKQALEVFMNGGAYPALWKQRNPSMEKPYYQWNGKIVDQKTEKIIPENIFGNHEKPLDFSSEYNTITSKGTSTDGAPKGNDNAAGPHKRSHLSKADKEKYKKRIVGQKTSDGVTITGFRDHAFDRIAQRNMSMGQIEKLLQSSQVSPDKTYPDRNCYDVPGKRLVLDKTTGEIVTIEWRRQNK